ncbi:MAG: hypothetical protein JWM27_1318 [Gemmatimonadetes bacterium]|nr:hypothetical protein [Gemmatimonadota bacterium]
MVVLVLAAAALGCAPGREVAPSGAPKLMMRSPGVYHFYRVEGGNARDISRSMQARRPWRDGSGSTGLTVWNVSWQARWVQAGPTCRAESTDVWLQVDVFLPEWRPRSDAGPQVAADWQAYVAALAVHEAGHVGIASSAASAVSRALDEFSAPACIGMRAHMRAEVERILDEYRGRDRSYDRKTRHGATQGAHWPRSAGAPIAPAPDSAASAGTE